MARNSNQEEFEAVQSAPAYVPPAPPPFTVPFRDWAETKLAYPREVFKSEYYRITGSQEDHYKLLREGWSDDRPSNHPYKPWTSSPDAVALAKRGIAELRAKASAEASKKTPEVTKDLIAEMIEKKFAETLGS
jgi:hypothetical protein